MNVQEWLRSLELEEYSELFHQEGYKQQCDITNMKQLDETQLKRMGVVKRGTVAVTQDSAIIITS